MKWIFLTILIIFSKISLSQDIDYPKYEVDSNGRKVVVLTIEQAQKLDNNTDLLYLFEKLGDQIGSYDSICIKTINDKNTIISEQSLLIIELKNSLNNKDSAISNLKSQIELYISNENICNNQIKNLNEQIELKDEKIRTQKTKMILGGGIGGLSIVGLIIGILFIR